MAYETPEELRGKSAKSYFTVANTAGLTIGSLFDGSGGFPLAAAYKCGLNYIGFELDEKWYKTAMRDFLGRNN